MKNYLSLLLLFYSFQLIKSNNNNFNNKISYLNNLNLKECYFECLFERNCLNWKYYNKERRKKKEEEENKEEENKEDKEDSICYLIYNNQDQINENEKDLKLILDSNLLENKYQNRNDLFQYKHILSGPVAIGRSTILNYDQSFVFGCTYSITAWVWVWKVPKHSGEMAFFTTRESLPISKKYQALLPSVVFNIGIRKKNIFFSANKDSLNDYEGVWGPELKFQEWIHITLTFVNDSMNIFINGEEYSPLIMSKDPTFSSHVCPECLSGEDKISTTNLSNNTIFQIGGSKIGTMFGLVQNVDIFQNIQLSKRQINKLMNFYPLKSYPTLDLLISQERNNNNGENNNGENNDNNNKRESVIFLDSNNFCDYELMNYNICPNIVCGTICIYNHFNHTIYDKFENLNSNFSNLNETEIEEDLEYIDEYLNEKDETEDIFTIEEEILSEDIIYLDGNEDIAIKLEVIKENLVKVENQLNNNENNVNMYNEVYNVENNNNTKIIENENKNNENNNEKYKYGKEAHRIIVSLEDKLWRSYLKEIRKSSAGDYYNDLSDDEIIALWYEQKSKPNEKQSEIWKQYLSEIRGSPLGDPYQDMTDEEVFEIWKSQTEWVSKETQNKLWIEYLSKIRQSENGDPYEGISDEEVLSTWENLKFELKDFTINSDININTNTNIATNIKNIEINSEDNNHLSEIEIEIEVDENGNQLINEPVQQDNTIILQKLENEWKKYIQNNHQNFIEEQVEQVENQQDQLNESPNVLDETNNVKIDSNTQNTIESKIKHLRELLKNKNTSSSQNISDSNQKSNRKIKKEKKQLNSENLGDKISEAVQKLFIAAEFKLQMEEHLRNPYHRHVTSSLISHKVKSNNINSSDDIKVINHTINTPLLIYENIHKFVTETKQNAQLFVKNIYQNTLLSIQNTVSSFGYEISLINITNSSNVTLSLNNSKVQELVEKMLSKLPNNKDKNNPDTIQKITDWITKYLSKQVGEIDDEIESLNQLLTGAEILFIDSDESVKKEKKLNPSIEKITKLYDNAMLWYTGRHLIHKYKDVITSSLNYENKNENNIITTTTILSDVVKNEKIEKDFDVLLTRYNDEVEEKAESMLIYAMWLSDELELEYPELVDHTSYYQSVSGMLGQPIRLALGYKTSSSLNNGVTADIDLIDSIDLIVNGSPEYLAIGRASSIEFKPKSNSIHSSNTKDNVNNNNNNNDNNNNLESTLNELEMYLDKYSKEDDSISFVKPRRNSVLNWQHEEECEVSGSYYLPVMKYVTTHFGDVETGVTTPEVILLSTLPRVDNVFGGLGGNVVGGVNGGGASTQTSNSGTNSIVESSIRQHYEAEAAAGNPDAQLWMGIRSYWGSAGLPANATKAREYFEKAAAQNHSEALFCLGALYENGQGGLPRNRTKSLELFRLSASQKIPWPAALQALGSYYWNNGPLSERNETLAIQYFEKAAEMGHANGYYSLGLMYRENSLNVTKQNIPLALHLMSLAASMGHIRAITNIAHALYDVESWLGHYAREQQLNQFKNHTNSSNTTITNLNIEENNLDKDNSEEEDNDDDLLLRWGYNSSNGIQIILSATSEIIRLTEPLQPDCKSALPLLKYISEYTYRPNDLTKSGVKAYLEGDIWGALELFEEAADLGVSSAQENTAFLYELIGENYCQKSKDTPNSYTFSLFSTFPSLFSTNSSINYLIETINEKYSQWKPEIEKFIPFIKNIAQNQNDNINSIDFNDVNFPSKYRGLSKIINSNSCKDYFEDMALIRLTQVAKNGNVEAIRRLAQRYQGMNSNTNFLSSSLSTSSLLSISKLFSLFSSSSTSTNKFQINKTKSALLYAQAALEHGDISSIMSLGEFVQKGIGGITKNITLAKLLYLKAGELENLYTKYGLSWATTNGVAPYIASLLATLENLKIQYLDTENDLILIVSLISILLILGLTRYFRYQ